MLKPQGRRKHMCDSPRLFKRGRHFKWKRNCASIVSALAKYPTIRKNCCSTRRSIADRNLCLAVSSFAWVPLPGQKHFAMNVNMVPWDPLDRLELCSAYRGYPLSNVSRGRDRGALQWQKNARMHVSRNEQQQRRVLGSMIRIELVIIIRIIMPTVH